MKQGLTEIVFILDKSGSMKMIESDAMGGFNSFIDQQRAVEGTANVTLILFDHYVETVYEGKDITEVEHLTSKTFQPSGFTSLLDSIGLGIDNFNKRISELPEEEKPENVIFAILTDGHENHSAEYTNVMVKNKIESMQGNDYQFIFLGANIDAVGTATSLGIRGEYAGNFLAKGDGASKAILHASEMVTSYRTTKEMKTYNDVIKEVLDSEKE